MFFFFSEVSIAYIFVLHKSIMKSLLVFYFLHFFISKALYFHSIFANMKNNKYFQSFPLYLFSRSCYVIEKQNKTGNTNITEPNIPIHSPGLKTPFMCFSTPLASTCVSSGVSEAAVTEGMEEGVREAGRQGSSPSHYSTKH